jgi:di/tricarboxylate transporter
MTILAISIISEGLQQTGVTGYIGDQLFRLAGRSEPRLVAATVLVAALLSLFMNNIAAAGVLMPVVILLSRRTRIPPSRLLMPMAFGTVLGGMATLLTTSNIIASDGLRAAGFQPFGLLDFLPIGLLVVPGGVLFLSMVGRRGLPRRYPAGQAARATRLHTELSTLYGIRRNMREIRVLPGSCMAGLNLKEGDWARQLGLNIIGISRGGHILFGPRREEVILEGDILLVQGEVIDAALEGCGLKMLSSPKLPKAVVDENTTLGEIVLSPRAGVAGKTLSQILFREKYQLNVLAIWREGRALQEGLADTPLRFGDALLIQGSPRQLRLLRGDRDFLLMEEDPDTVRHPGKAGLAATITILALGIAAMGWFPVAEICLVGSLLMVLAGCMTMDDAYRAVEWKAIFLIAGMWPIGIAMQTTGLASTITRGLLGDTASMNPMALAVILLLAGLLLAQLLGAQVSAIVLMPIGLTMALSMHVDPRAIGMAVALGCSLAFLTPLGHPVNIMVMGSGGYTFRDYFRVGGPLTLLTLLLVILGLHLFWGL